MKLDANGYNSIFRSFTDFAQQKMDEHDAKAVVDAKVQQPLAEQKILSVTKSATDKVHKWLRTNTEYAANNTTRTIFKAAIIDMFGGESKIPASVKQAMLLSDFDCGKPLTARRIIAVKAAIDRDGTARLRSAKLALETFQSPDVKTEALNLGFKKGDLPKLARAAHFYAQTMHVSEMDAMRAVADPASKAYRLMNYGGRFLQSAENFANGLRLIDSFANWFREIKNTMEPVHDQPRETRDFSTANTLTKLNVDCNLFIGDKVKGIEKFVFEELASNPAHDLTGNDPELLFGFEHNAAMRFVGRGYGNSALSTIANIPPAKRAVIYAAYDLFTKQARNAQEAHNQNLSGDEHRTQIDTNNSPTFLARLLRHFDKLEDMYRKGTLTARNILNKFFPDIRNKGNYDYHTINRHFSDITILINSEEEEGNIYADLSPGVIATTMNNCGTTLEETARYLRSNRMPPIPKMLCTGSIPLDYFDGTIAGGRDLVAGDAIRPGNYLIRNGQQPLLAGNDASFGFTFPDGTRLIANGTRQGQANVPVILDKVEALCGRVHVAQTNSVMMMLSQSGMMHLRGGIPSLGVVCNEHAAVEYSLSKDEKTGMITIKYSSPQELPFRFSWTSTVDINGNVTSTPMVTEKPVDRLDNRSARALVDKSAKELGVKLTRSQTNEAVQLLCNYGTNMYAKNAKLFANFLVNLVTSGLVPAIKLAMASETAASLRMWRDFDFGDKQMSAFNEAAKAQINATISDHMQPAKNNKFTDNIFDTTLADLPRGIFNLNGTTFKRRPANEFVTAFKNLVPEPHKQKAISCWLCQLGTYTFLFPSNHVPYETGVEAHNLPGAGSLVNRNLMTGLFNTQILDPEGLDFVHDLQISPDGRTATITQTFTADLASPGSGIQHKISFGRTVITQRLVIDLTPEIPTVTDYKISQTIT